MIKEIRKISNSEKSLNIAKNEAKRIMAKVLSVEISFYQYLFEENNFTFNEILESHNQFLREIDNENNVYFKADLDYLNNLVT
jgi:hypothetical protein